MKKCIEEGLKPLDGYLISINRNTVKGWYELQIGVHADWIYKSNELIKCEPIKKGEDGHILIISPKNDNVVVDDLVAFVELIIETNQKIREKEKEFTDKMNRVKEDLNKQAKDFYESLNDLKEKSFSKFNFENIESTPAQKGKKNNTSEKNVKDSNVETTTTTQKRGRGRPPKKNNNDQKENK